MPLRGGLEIISTEDMLARLDDLNKRKEDWTSNSWLEGHTEDNLVTCSTCVSEEEYVFDENNPERCKCDMVCKFRAQNDNYI